MGLRDLVMGRPACAAPGSSSSSSSSTPLSSFADAFLGYSPRSEFKMESSASAVLMKASLDLLKAVPLSTVPGDENEIGLDQGSIRSMKGTDFVNGHHGYACGENFQTSTRSVPELNGPPEMDVPHLHQSQFQHNVLRDRSKECFQGLVNRSLDSIDHSYYNKIERPRIIWHPQMDKFRNQLPKPLYELPNSRTEVLPHSSGQQHGGWISEFEQAQSAKDQIVRTEITNMVVVAQPYMLEQTSAHDDHPKFQGVDVLFVSDDEISGGWLSFLGIALSHLSGLSQPRFWDEPIKLYEQVIGHRVWIIIEGLQQRSGWSVKVEATRKTLFDAVQDAAMLAVITMRMHFPLEFQGTPFTVLPMQPGRRSKLDYPAIGGGAEAAIFMGINYDDVATLLRESFASFNRERWVCQAFEEYVIEKQQILAVTKNMLEELPPTLEKNRLMAHLSEMGKMEDKFVPGDCGWSVFVTNKVQQQVEPSHPEEKSPATEASSLTVSVRARL